MAISSTAPTFSSLRRTVRHGGGAADSNTQITQAVGEAFVARMLQDITGGQAHQLGQLREAIGVVKELDEVGDRRRSRQQAELEDLMQELETLRKDLRKTRAGGEGGENSLTVLVVKALMDQQAKAEERMMTLVKEMREDQERREKERRELEQNSSTQFFANFGLESLKGRLNSDPLEEYKRQHEFWSQILQGADTHRDEVAFQRWAKEQEFNLRKLEIERQYDADDRNAKARASSLADLAQIAGALTGQPVAGGASGSGVFRYTCAGCGNEFAVPDPGLARVCPACGNPVAAPGAGAAGMTAPASGGGFDDVPPV